MNYNFGTKRDIDVLSSYLVYMACKRDIVFSDSKMDYSYFRYEGRKDKESIKCIQDIIYQHISDNCFIILREYRKNAIVNSSFLVYKNRIVKLSDAQTENIVTNLFDIKETDNNRFVNSLCSIPDFGTIKEKALQDREFQERYLLKEQF